MYINRFSLSFFILFYLFIYFLVLEDRLHLNSSLNKVHVCMYVSWWRHISYARWEIKLQSYDPTKVINYILCKGKRDAYQTLLGITRTAETDAREDQWEKKWEDAWWTWSQIQRSATPDRQHSTALWDFACMHVCMYWIWSLTGTAPPVSYLIEY